MKKVCVHVRTAVNAAGIRKERQAGRDVVIVPSATMPDNIVMNGVRYPAAEIEKSFPSLNMTPAPLGHPEIEGGFISASDPRGLARSWIGAWNQNVRRENGRVWLDKVIDVETANRYPGGKAVLEAIEKGEPIHTSTGLVCMMDDAEEGAADGATFVASSIVFDHDAILLGESGAATPSQGVGMLVHSAAGDGSEEIEVLNASFEEDADDHLDWAIKDLARALEHRDKAGYLERLKSAILEVLPGLPRRETPTNRKESDVMSDEAIKALSDKFDGIVEGLEAKISAAVNAAVKPISDGMAALENAEKAKEEQELAELRNSIVESGLLDEEAAGELTLKAARGLANKATDAAATPGRRSAAVHSAQPTGDKPGFLLPKSEG